MAKIIDISDKLDFDVNPKLIIKGKEYEVNADAETVLKIMGELGNGEVTPKAINNMYVLLFSEETRCNIAELKLKFNDFKKLVETAVDLIIDSEDGSQGE